jgi:hypothetical protein
MLMSHEVLVWRQHSSFSRMYPARMHSNQLYEEAKALVGG